MELDDLLGDGEAEAGAAGAAAAGGVQAVELLEYPLQLVPGYVVALVGETEMGGVAVNGERDGDVRAIIAVVDGVAQQVVEHALELVRVAGDADVRRGEHAAGKALFRQQRREFVRRLRQHTREADRLQLQREAGERKARDVEEFVDEVLQPLGLVQGDGEVMLPQLGGYVPLVAQEREVADDGGEGRFQVVREIDDKVVLALVRLLGRQAAGEHVGLDAVHLHFDLVQVVGEGDGAVP